MAQSEPREHTDAECSNKTLTTARSMRVQHRPWEKSLRIKCRFCGGGNCRRCSRQCALNKTDSPVKGLHADFVTSQILGMMRPSTKLMKEFNILEQFKDLGIVAVINVTLPGEHPYCGDGLVTSGFPYNPEDFMASSIQFYNFGWEDMTVPTLSYMMNIVKVMASILEDGVSKVAVHCHAGYGRTGLAIACTLIYMHKMLPDQVIKIVRKNRPGSIQTSKQEAFVKSFYTFLNCDRAAEAYALLNHSSFTLSEALTAQSRRLHGADAQKYAHIPKVIDELCTRIEKSLSAAEDTNSRTAIVTKFISHVPGSETDSIDEKWNDTLGTFNISTSTPDPVSRTQSRIASKRHIHSVKRAVNEGAWHAVDSESEIALLLEWLEHLKDPLLSPDSIKSLMILLESHSTDSAWAEFNSKQSKGVLRTMERLQTCFVKLMSVDSTYEMAICTRATVSLCHLNVHEIDTAALSRYSEFIKELLTSWKAPRLNFVNTEKIKSMRNIIMIDQRLPAIA